MNLINESGKVFVKGKAAGQYTCDRVAIKLEFYSVSASGAKAVEENLAQCERFLECIEKYGIDISEIRLQNDKVENPSYREDEKIKASRTIKFDMKAKPETINLILRVLQEENLNVTLSTDYYLSNEAEKRRELKGLAILNSRENAEIVAMAAGRRISCVDTIDIANQQIRPRRKKDTVWDDVLSLFDKPSEKLSMPTLDIEEEVDVAWCLE